MNVLKTSTFVICVHMTIKILDLFFSDNFWLIQMFLSPTFNFKRRDHLIVTIVECADCTFYFYTPADHIGVRVTEKVITDCAPVSFVVNLNAALTVRFVMNQTDNCENKNNFNYICIYPVVFCDIFNVLYS